VVAREDFEIEAGSLQIFEAPAASGNTVWRSFCPICGTPVGGGSLGFDRVIVKAGTLDDPGLFKAEAAIWTAEAPPWHHFDPGVPSFPRDPPGTPAAA
jgi:hypothetical protein